MTIFKSSLLSLAAVLWAGAAPVGAAESGQSAGLKGYRDFLSGVLPPPGVQLRNDVQIYSGKESSQIPPGHLDAELRSVLDVFGITIVTPYKFLDGHYAVSVRTAGSYVSAYRAVTRPVGPAAVASKSLIGFNDIVVTPFVLGWHAGNWHWNVSTSVWIPAGDYQAARLANVGKNTWAWSPQAAITYLDLQSGWEVSAATGYLLSAENPATHYRSGDVIHIDAGVAKRVTPSLWLGGVGFALKQVTDDTGSGNTLGPRRASVFGLGPAARMNIMLNDTPALLVVKYLREFDATNTTRGDTVTMSLRVNF